MLFAWENEVLAEIKPLLVKLYMKYHNETRNCLRKKSSEIISAARIASILSTCMFIVILNSFLMRKEEKRIREKRKAFEFQRMKAIVFTGNLINCCWTNGEIVDSFDISNKLFWRIQKCKEFYNDQCLLSFLKKSIWNIILVVVPCVKNFCFIPILRTVLRISFNNAYGPDQHVYRPLSPITTALVENFEHISRGFAWYGRDFPC